MKKATLFILAFSPIIIFGTLWVSMQGRGPGEKALATAIAQLPTPTPIHPLSKEFSCQKQEDLERYVPGDQIILEREIWLVENPTRDHPAVTGIVAEGNIVIVDKNDNGIHCVNIKEDTLYYVCHINDEGRVDARGFAPPDNLEESG